MVGGGVPRRLRLLCLHGWRTNAAVMNAQLQGFRKAFGPDGVDFTILHAPFAASGPAHTTVSDNFDGPFFEWWDYIEHPAGAPKRHEYVGWKASLEFAMDRIDRDGPFDALVGFSQGAGMATLLTAHYSSTTRIPYSAVVLCCGLLPRDGMPRGLALPLSIPSFHILGKADSRYGWGRKLLSAYDPRQRQVFEHAGGHRFPVYPEYMATYNSIAHDLRAICIA
ncbi:hypothetical protein H310_14123 [Aphanomyces invadans]|uniref:Serine hydrolase domain-containing protein n=1 Tax=Aphanomyces invadans TaxID=157072 RepID=A0A024TCI7_9STRA|nr:hypothetical protein H310_14123 [Aphanomyces invadans]ETV91301.1 hypothetical protein H310_14123 [Aphanomyces invadans]|eukprot:XP_008880138.1 hypothetical protein H310_14123 [Aphanomyces invadans]